MALTKCKECGEAISKKAEKCPKCGAPAKKKTSLFTWLVTIIIFMSAVGYFTGNTDRDTSRSFGSNNSPSQKEIAARNIEAEFTWHKVGFGNVMEADFTITNNSNYQIKDIEIRCTHSAKSGTKIDSNKRIVYDIVPAKSKKTFSKFNMGFIHSQTESTSCRITDFKM